MKALQTFSDEYLERCAEMSADEIAKFVDDFRLVHGAANIVSQLNHSPSKLISIKIPMDLLNAFKTKAYLQGVPYQSEIKRLMRTWLSQGK